MPHLFPPYRFSSRLLLWGWLGWSCFQPGAIQAKECIVGPSPQSFASITMALAEGCRSLTVLPGEYPESFILGEGVQLVGTDRETTRILGTVILSDQTTLQSITIVRGGVRVELDADAWLDQVKITGSALNGIETTGFGLLRLTDSTIEHSAKKGLSIGWGKTLAINNSVIQSNAEEGLDIHGHVSGSVTHSTLASNGESGAEIVVAETNLVLEENIFQKNEAHGIAFQYYAYEPKRGYISVKNNTFSDSKKTAITCKNPSGGEREKEYWQNSIFVTAVASQSDADMIKNCTGVAVRETQEATSSPEDSTSRERVLAVLPKEKREQRQRLEEEARQKLERLILSVDAAQEARESSKQLLEQKPRWKRWLFGYTKTEIKALEEQKQLFTVVRLETEALMQRSYAPDIRPRIIELYTAAVTHLESIQTELSTAEHQGLLRW